VTTQVDIVTQFQLEHSQKLQKKVLSKAVSSSPHNLHIEYEIWRFLIQK